MNARERKLAGMIGLLAALLIGVLGVQRVVLKPVRDIEKSTRDYRSQLAELQKEKRAFFAAEDRLKEWAAKTFSDDTGLASARSGALLTELIVRCGLEERNFSRLPIGPQRLRGAQEVGWSVQGLGSLKRVLDLLFLLERSPYLHHVENLTLSPSEAGDSVRVNFRYWTLVLDPAPVVEFAPREFKVDLASSERRFYDVIEARNLLAPALPVEPPPPEPPPPPTPSVPGPETFRVVSLSQWRGRPEVHVHDSTTQRTMRYVVGDSLAGGTIVAVDYRPLKLSPESFLKSNSRVIVQIGAEYWAIDEGATLADKVRLSQEMLPPELVRAD